MAPPDPKQDKWRPFRLPMGRNLSSVDRIHRTKLSSFGSVVHEPGGHYGPRFQDRYELLFLRSGSLTAFIDEIRLDVPAGQVVLLRPGHKEWLKFSDDSQSARDWTTLHRDMVPSSILTRIAVAPMVVDFTDEMRVLLDVALELPEEITPMSALVLDHMALALLAMFVRKVENVEPSKRALPQAVVRSIEYMELNLSHHLSLKDIAGAACITSHHLIKLFTSHLGMPPAKYLWKMRLQRSGELLRRTPLGVAEVAYMVGFQSPFHFSRSFKAAYGVSPKTYRESL